MVTDHPPTTTTHHRDVPIQVVWIRTIRRTTDQKVIFIILYNKKNSFNLLFDYIEHDNELVCDFIGGAPGELRGVVGWGLVVVVA